jgi:Xaa-Pro aminopeptidase
MKQGLTDVPTWGKWLKEVRLLFHYRPPILTRQELPKSSKIGIDPTVLSFSELQALSKSLTEDSTNSLLVPLPDNLVDMVWSDRPPRPANPVFKLDDEYTGQSMEKKLAIMQDILTRIGSPGMVIGQLDEVAWLFNLRGSDIPYNPVSGLDDV